MERTWQLQEAKNKLSEVVETAMTEGPQRITKRGKPAVVMVAAHDFERLTRRDDSLLSFLQAAPLADLELERTEDKPRQVEL